MKLSRPGRLLFVCIATLALPLTAAEPAPAGNPPPVTPATLAPLLAALREASATGDLAAARKHYDSRPAVPGGRDFQEIQLELACTALDLGEFARALEHYRAAGAPRDRAWIAGLAHGYQRDWVRLDRLIADLKAESSANHPLSYYYLRALRGFLQWRDLPLGATGTRVPANDIMFDAQTVLSPKSRNSADFQPRLLRLAALVADARRVPSDISENFLARAQAFPRNLAYARAALANFVITNTPAGKKYLASLNLPPDEAAVWLRAFDARPPDGLLFIYHDKVTAAAALPATPSFDESRFILLRAALSRSLENVDRPRRADGSFELSPEVIARFRAEYHADVFVSAALEFAQLAATSVGFHTDADDALLLWDLLGLGTERPSTALAELELDLARRANDHARAVRLILGQAPAHATDPRWLGRHARVIAEHAPLADALSYLRRLEKTEPESLSVLLALAGLALRPEVKQEMAHYIREITRPQDQNGPASLLGKIAVTDDILTSPGARLALYQRVFAETPKKIIPSSPHWAAYRSLLRHDADLNDLLDDEPGNSPPEKDAFTELVERCHAVAPKNPIVAEQYALLLARRAQAGFNRTTHAAFLSALAAADQAGAPLGELTRFQTAFAAHAEKNAAQSRAKAEQVAADTTARIARERAAQDKDITAARARASAIRTLGQQLDRRREYLVGLPSAIASLREKLKGNYDPANKADFRASIAAIEREIENLCRQCKGFGVKEDGKSVSRCAGCSGSGLRGLSGGGTSAGFESLTTPITLDSPPAKSPQSKSGSR